MWTTEMLSSVVNISPGNSIPAKKKSELFTGVKGMPYVATKDVSFDGIINYDNGICIPQDYLNNFRVSPKYATLICAEGGSAGRKIAFSHDECCYVNKLFSLQPTNKIIPKFLYYYSISAEFQLQFKAALHGLIGGVSLTKMKKFAISYPSIPEQERIVAKLDAAFAEIDRARNRTSDSKANANSLYDICLKHVFGDFNYPDSSFTLADVTELIVDCEHKTAPTQEAGIALVRTPNIKKGTLELDSAKRISQETYEVWTRRAKPAADDLILAREAPAGNVGVVPKGEDVCLGQRTVLIRAKINLIHHQYLCYFLLHPDVQDSLLSKSRGATVQHVNLRDIRSLPIPQLPSIEHQIEKVRAFKTMLTLRQRLIDATTQKIQLIEQLKLAILTKELQPSQNEAA